MARTTADLAQDIVRESDRQKSIKTAKAIIGDKKLFVLIDEKNRRKMRVFIVDHPGGGDDIFEVTGLVSRVTDHKMTEDGHWLIGSNYGYGPEMGIAGDYALAMGESDSKDKSTRTADSNHAKTSHEQTQICTVVKSIDFEEDETGGDETVLAVFAGLEATRELQRTQKPLLIR